MAKRNSAARPEGQILAHALRLHQQLGDVVALGVGADRGVSHGEARNLPGGGYVSFQQQRRYREHVRVIVIAVTGLVGRKKRFAVNLQRQQIADRVGVFGAVEAMEGRPAGVGLGGGRAVQLRFQVRRQRIIPRAIGPGHPDGRHGAGPKLADHFFPDGGARRNIFHIQLVEHQVGRLESFVMAGDAVAGQKRPLF